jgi:CzcA family heavy metal efflux pump
LALVALLTGLGFVAMRQVPLDAVPDLSDVQVIVLTEWEGHATPLVEDQLTAPLSAGLVSTPGVQTVRGQSFFGLSFVTVIFEDGTDLYAARSRVSERLGTLQGRLPLGVAPALGPDASGVGWVLMYALKDTAGQADLAQLRAVQDWELRPQLEAVPGVAEVATLGGFERQLQVEVSPEALAARGLRLTDVEMAVRAANADAGGGVIELGGQEHMIRSRGYLRGPDELLAAPLMRAPDGATVTVGDVAEARWGPAMRRGIAELDGQGEVVGGIIVMRQGADARAVIGGVKDRLVALQASLPPGVEVVITYDRSELIDAAIHTLQGTLIEELIVVSAVIVLFLLSVRSALVPILTLPVAVLIAFIPMAAQGLGANIMSLGGVAVAIGAMVDASIILVENVHKRLEEWAEAPGDRPRSAVVVGAMQEVGPSIFFSLLVITVSFLPVFSLQATEGRLFRPLAFTKTYAMGFAALLAVTLTPALVALLLRGPVRREADHPLSRRLSAAYAPVVRAVVRRPLLGGGRGPRLDGGDRAGLPQPAARVHAAPARGRAALHAVLADGHAGGRGQPHPAAARPPDQGGARGRPGLRQDGPGRQRHRPCAAGHGRDHHPAQAPRPVAARPRLGRPRGRARRGGGPAGHAQPLVDAHPDPHRDVEHGRAQPPGPAGQRPQPRRHRAAEPAARAGPAQPCPAPAAPRPSAAPAASPSTSTSTAPGPPSSGSACRTSTTPSAWPSAA